MKFEILKTRNPQDFSKLSGDKNPIHLDENYGNKSKFGYKINYGSMITYD